MSQNGAHVEPRTVFGRAPRKSAGGVHPGLVYAAFAGLCITNVLTLVAFLMAPDIAALLDGRRDDAIVAYEDRIASLRIEVDRLHSRNYAQAGDINLQLQELSQQQDLLLEQQYVVRQLAARAEELGLVPSETAAEDEADVAIVPAGTAPAAGTADDIAAAAARVETMMTESRVALATISDAATTSADEILDALGAVGINPRLPEIRAAMGGPYLPASGEADETNLVDDANAVVEALAVFKAARDALDVAPVHRPLDGYTRISSGYGNRKDPFTKGKAFHSGLDMPAPNGTLVLSAGFGRVSFVGEKSGYGRVVEVIHGGGILTRYAHLSAWLVEEGQVVETGSPIAKVGSTGRSTGPHLHFEVRRGDGAIDPGPYLAAGAKLARFVVL